MSLSYLDANYSSAASDMLASADKVYKAFSGTDMTAYIGPVRVGKLQGLTCSITREVMPIYVSGDPNAKAFSKGKRGIAGNLVFTQFDRHAILRDILQPDDSSNKQTLLTDLWAQASGNTGFGSLKPQDVQPATYLTQATAKAVADELAATYWLVRQRKVNYVDSIPPFDITVTLVNENGDAATLGVLGVQLINEGFGYTLDDLHSETAFTYIARAVTPLDNLQHVLTLTPGH